MWGGWISSLVCQCYSVPTFPLLIILDYSTAQSGYWVILIRWVNKTWEFKSYNIFVTKSVKYHQHNSYNILIQIKLSCNKEDWKKLHWETNIWENKKKILLWS